MDWTITAMDVLARNDADVVVRVYYTATMQDSGYTAQRSSVQTIVYAPNQPFTPYDQLTQAEVVKWVQEAMGEDQLAVLSNELTADIERQKNPPIVPMPLPWAVA